MKKVKKVLAVVFLTISVLTSSLFAAAAVCPTKHATTITTSSNVSSWITQHKILLEENNNGNNEAICYGYHWVEEVRHNCKSCGYLVGSEKFFHERHTICGVNY